MEARHAIRMVLAGAAVAAVVAVACGQGAGTFGGSSGSKDLKGSKATGVPDATTKPKALDEFGLGGGSSDTGHPGVDLVPLHVQAFIFGDAVVDPAVQPGSRTLADTISGTKRLRVVALPSADGTAAVDFLEISPPGHLWGEQMIPAERLLFRSFAADAALGDALVVVDDVQVDGGPDPLPMTAYRWDRADVEAYARCGIPDREIEGCTDAFYMAAEMILVGQFGTQRGA
jgi:hypothetical protein